jgi:hypothetical protein
MIKYTGIQNVLESIEVNSENILAAFSFYHPNTFNNFVYPDDWAGNSCTGVLNQNINFYNFSGSGFFDGNNYMFLSGRNINLENSLVFLSYQKQREGSEILLSSFEGNEITSYSGFTLGVNSANKLYLSYWNNVEGYFNFTFQNILSDKNLIFLYKDGPILSIGKYNNNNFDFEIESFDIFENVFIESNKFYLGGHPSRNIFNQKDLNFSGVIDKFFIINSNNIYNMKSELAFGLYSNFSYIEENIAQICFPTGYFSGSGFLYSGTLETYLSGYEIITTGITGYQFISSGTTYSGLTGYESISIGFYTDNCGVSKELFIQNPLSGLIVIDNSFNQGLTGLISTTGYLEIINSGLLSGTEMIWVSGQSCNDIVSLVPSSNMVDLNYLSSLSYKEISLLSDVKNEDIIEIYSEPYQNTTLVYNKNLFYNSLNDTFFAEEPVSKDILLFANGQSLINNGFELITNGYEIIKIANTDHFITGLDIEVNKNYNFEDFLFYDYLSGNSWGFENTGSIVNLPENIGSNYWVFKNGQKLIFTRDYSLINGGNSLSLFQTNADEVNKILLKIIPDTLIKVTGNLNSLNINNKFNHQSSQVYYNGLKQKINNNYIENSHFDLISGNFNENKDLDNIYNNTDDFLTYV